MIATFYIIEIETRLAEPIQYYKVLQEGYTSRMQAEKFILSRSDNPQQITLTYSEATNTHTP